MHAPAARAAPGAAGFYNLALKALGTLEANKGSKIRRTFFNFFLVHP
jgi:hypothetical protein